MQRNIDKRIVADEFLRRAAGELAEDPADLFIVYYRLPDFMSHSLWLFYDDSEFTSPADPLEKALFGESLKESYRFVDEAIGELLAKWDGRANVLIVSDHGFGSSLSMEKGEETRSFHLTGNHRPHGVMLATGPDIQPGELQGMTAMDVTPTMLAMLGLPVSDQLPGEVTARLLRPGLLEEQPIRTVADYSDITIAREEFGMDIESLAEDMSALRGLGYVGEGVELASDELAGEYDFWAADNPTVVNIIASEVMYFLMKGDLEAAQSGHDLLVSQRPELNDKLVRKVQGRYLSMIDQLSRERVDTELFDAYVERNRETARLNAEREKKKEARKKSSQQERRE